MLGKGLFNSASITIPLVSGEKNSFRNSMFGAIIPPITNETRKRPKLNVNAVYLVSIVNSLYADHADAIPRQIITRSPIILPLSFT